MLVLFRIYAFLQCIFLWLNVFVTFCCFVETPWIKWWKAEHSTFFYGISQYIVSLCDITSYVGRTTKFTCFIALIIILVYATINDAVTTDLVTLFSITAINGFNIIYIVLLYPTFSTTIPHNQLVLLFSVFDIMWKDWHKKSLAMFHFWAAAAAVFVDYTNSGNVDDGSNLLWCIFTWLIDVVYLLEWKCNHKDDSVCD